MYDNVKWAALDKADGSSVPAPKLAALWIVVGLGAVILALVALLA
jgi:hypothetical protein